MPFNIAIHLEVVYSHTETNALKTELLEYNILETGAFEAKMLETVIISDSSSNDV